MAKERIVLATERIMMATERIVLTIVGVKASLAFFVTFLHMLAALVSPSDCSPKLIKFGEGPPSRAS
ncbi:hypothetical protein ElyMa_000065500 [Elysia marginata]|uniref:Uncharacterized protein n=1 Tax=Elysia marginata TaxID=1093978 RepID=A0AAV4EH19_9GAST|nr:hypothetical protein ElyMa_000065500 [Elysia marginata]